MAIKLNLVGTAGNPRGAGSGRERDTQGRVADSGRVHRDVHGAARGGGGNADCRGQPGLP